MAKELITGLVVREDVLEWTSMAVEKGLGQVTDVRRIDVDPEPLESDAAVEGAEQEPEVISSDPLMDWIKKECRGVKGAVSASVSSDQLLTRVIRLPLVPEDEMAGMVRLQLDKISPFPVEEMVFSYETLAESPDERTVLLVAVKETIVDKLESRIGAAGLSTSRVDIAMMGWRQLIEDARQIHKAGRHVMLIQDGPAVEMLVALNGVLVEFRSLPISGDAWGDDLASEVHYTLISQELEHGAGGVTLISIWHAAPLPAHLKENLKETFSCDVEIRPLKDLPPLSEGLARRALPSDEVRLDLTPQHWRDTEKEKGFKKKLLVVAEVLLGLWLVGVGVIIGGGYYQNWLLEKLQARQAEWKKPADAVKEMCHRVRMIGKYMDRTHSGIECLREITVLLPKGVELTSFSFRKSEVIKISGKSGAVNLVYSFKSNLDKSELFPDVTLTGPRFDRRSRRQMFDIEIKLPGGEE